MKRAFPAWLGVLLCALSMSAAAADAPDFEFRAPRSADEAGLSDAVRDLAERVLPVYEEPDQDRYLANLSVLQLAAGNAKAAADTRQALRDRRRSAGQPAGRDLLLDLYAQARAAQAGGGSFAGAFAQAFREAVPKLGDREAYAVTEVPDEAAGAARESVQAWLDRLHGRERIARDEAIELIRAYIYLVIYREAGLQLRALTAEDDARRYAIEDFVVPGSARIHAQLVRPRRQAKSTTLLEFTVAAAPDNARACAARGYAGVVAYVRGKNPQAVKPGRERVVPFEHDGEDARAVIRWIAKQAWSDGRVGMYGERYAGFAAWAAAKHPPAALKAIATADPMAPGIDFPTGGRIFRNDAYRWAELHTRRTLGNEKAEDRDWPALDLAWYRSGKSYRALDVLAGDPNRVFRRWLGHPSYDRYWQKLIPFGEEFSKIDLPILTVSGYYAAAQPAALYYFGEHLRTRAKAEHALVLGPYADAADRGVPPPALRGYTLDAAALTDLRALRWQWFDHIFKGAAKPPLLQDRVNYEVMGANRWRHAPSLQAMANAAQRFYLDGRNAGGSAKLAGAQPSRSAHVDLGVDLADRSDAELSTLPQVQARKLDLRHAVSFVSEPLPQPLELGGVLSGRLDFRVNKFDLDLSLALYELTAGGDYVLLSAPYELRLSYAADPTQRKSLMPGERRQLAFRSERVMSKLLAPGSRLVLILGVVKRPDRELNYGSGKDVSEESAADAGAPLKLRWYGGSYIDLPVRK